LVFFQAEDGIRDWSVTGVQTCALPILRKGQLRLGSNLFHYGVIIVILGHFAGFLAPHWAVAWALDPVGHQLLAMVVGGIAGLVEIGRASCRERVEVAVVARSVSEKLQR